MPFIRVYLISMSGLKSRAGLVSMAELVSRVQGGMAKAASTAASSRGRLDTVVLAWCPRHQQSSGAGQHVSQRHSQFSGGWRQPLQRGHVQAMTEGGHMAGGLVVRVPAGRGVGVSWQMQGARRGHLGVEP